MLAPQASLQEQQLRRVEDENDEMVHTGGFINNLKSLVGRSEEQLARKKVIKENAETIVNGQIGATMRSILRAAQGELAELFKKHADNLDEGIDENKLEQELIQAMGQQELTFADAMNAHDLSPDDSAKGLMKLLAAVYEKMIENEQKELDRTIEVLRKLKKKAEDSQKEKFSVIKDKLHEMNMPEEVMKTLEFRQPKIKKTAK